MNLQLLGILTFIVLLIALNVYFRMKQSNSKTDRFVWQPDLSHKVLIQESPPTTSRGAKQKTIILVEKSPEERAEEQRSYLRAKK
jgi:hypothetical protein